MIYYEEILCKMFSVDTYREVPYTLRNRIERINNNSLEGGGRGLRSTQIIAMIVEQWERDYGYTED